MVCLQKVCSKFLFSPVNRKLRVKSGLSMIASVQAGARQPYVRFGAIAYLSISLLARDEIDTLYIQLQYKAQNQWFGC